MKIKQKFKRESAAKIARGQTQLAVSEARYRRLFETAQDGILLLNANTGKITDVNPYLLKMLGYPKDDILGKNLWQIGVFKDIKESRKSFSELQTKKYVRYEHLPLETKDGRQINVEFVSNVYSVDSQRVIQCNIRDISERVRAEGAVQRSLNEKEILLKELHHRVKNSLQIVSSLLQLKSANSENQDVIDVFKQTQGRIKVMALVHEKLCEAKDFMNIEIFDYVQDLVKGLVAVYGIDRKKIKVKAEVEKLMMKIDIMVPCGLIINELLTNAFKYAFPGNRQGEIIIGLRLVNKKMLEIIVKDNGIGLRKGFNVYKSKTMGLALVVSTVENQLGGRVRFYRTGGTQVKIGFKI